ncbi:hypothetical protein [Lysobacter capsici]|uniref:hypothetical protein n=1 Tax=Lysobacter capsici TaxID=435897 RepID=UPI00062821CB|nr:hypothetical protein [Lysobacter capsici]
MADALYLACKTTDINETTGECANPYWGTPPQFFPTLSAEDGALIAAGIVGFWTLGLMGRMIIRTLQQETNSRPHG